jgi:hypothetical protein
VVAQSGRWPGSTGGNHETLRNWVEQPYPVRLLCRVLQVSTSAFYDWIGRGRPPVSEDDLNDAYRANLMHDAWAQHRRTYGARRLTAEISDRGHPAATLVLFDSWELVTGS